MVKGLPAKGRGDTEQDKYHMAHCGLDTTTRDPSKSNANHHVHDNGPLNGGLLVVLGRRDVRVVIENVDG